MGAIPGTKKTILAAMVLVTVYWMTGCRYRSAACKQRGIALNSQVEALKRRALERLTIGTKKEDVVRFFAENKFPINFDETWGATGSIDAKGCSPTGCGTDDYVIVLTVRLDESGNVKSKPVVGGGYADCL